jgi:hypothetical protein
MRGGGSQLRHQKRPCVETEREESSRLSAKSGAVMLPAVLRAMWNLKLV